MNPTVTASDKLTKARVQLLLSHPFFAALALRLQLVDKTIKTMATDGRAIYYSPIFVDSLTPAELQGVLAHEVLHCALGHHCRRGDRTPTRWNHACDYAINPILIDNGFELPAGGLLSPEYRDLSAEEIYSRLPPDADGGGSQPKNDEQESDEPGGAATGSGSGSTDPASITATEQQEPSTEPGFGEVLDAVDDNGAPASDADKSQQQRDWAVATQQAANAAKSCGHSPLGVERVLEDTGRSHVNWRAVLRDFVAATTPADYRFSPPNRRYVHAGLYLPSIHKEGTGPLVLAVDTSCSIGAEELKQFAAEITAIAEDAQPERIHVVYCDAAVQTSQELTPGESIVLTPKGGGGTNFRPVFDWVDDQNIQPACLLYLTDLACDKYPASPPDYPVLWVTDSRRVAPFGETVQILAD